MCHYELQTYPVAAIVVSHVRYFCRFLDWLSVNLLSSSLFIEMTEDTRLSFCSSVLSLLPWKSFSQRFFECCSTSFCQVDWLKEHQVSYAPTGSSVHAVLMVLSTEAIAFWFFVNTSSRMRQPPKLVVGPLAVVLRYWYTSAVSTAKSAIPTSFLRTGITKISVLTPLLQQQLSTSASVSSFLLYPTLVSLRWISFACVPFVNLTPASY